MIKKGKESLCYIDRAGEIHVTNQGEIIEILETLGHSKNIIKFSDGTIKENVAYNNIKSGAVEKPEERVGKQTVTKQGYTIEIINYVNSSNCTVLFLETKNTKKTTFREFVTKTITNPLHRGVYNVGFEGVGLYDFKSNKKDAGCGHLCYKEFAVIATPLIKNVQLMSVGIIFRILQSGLKKTTILI